MSNDTFPLGTILYISRPTKALIKKHSLDVHPSKHLKDVTVVNGISVRNVYFGCSAIYSGYHDEISKAGTTVVEITDKARVKKPENKLHLIGHRLSIPTEILRKKERIIDIRKIAYPVIDDMITYIINREDGSLLAGHKMLPKKSLDVFYETRKHVPVVRKDSNEITKIDYELLKMAKIFIRSMASLRARENKPFRCTACGHTTSYKTISNYMYKDKGTDTLKYRCRSCGIKYAMVLTKSGLKFKSLSKKYVEATILSKTVVPIPVAALDEDDDEEIEERGGVRVIRMAPRRRRRRRAPNNIE
jgi:transcription elongation factor Elf1